MSHAHRGYIVCNLFSCLQVSELNVKVGLGNARCLRGEAMKSIEAHTLWGKAKRSESLTLRDMVCCWAYEGLGGLDYVTQLLMREPKPLSLC